MNFRIRLLYLMIIGGMIGTCGNQLSIEASVHKIEPIVLAGLAFNGSMPVGGQEDILNSENNLKNAIVLFSWVEKLDMQERPDSKSRVVAQVNMGDSLLFEGEKSAITETIVLHGVAYEDHWLKVNTSVSNRSGWVFGGAVRERNEVKGNDEITNEAFDFPHFGFYNLKKWTSVDVNKENKGDAIIATLNYKKDENILKIEKKEEGEYGYSRSYQLMDVNKNLLKTRNFEFNVNPELLITETVIDYTVTPTKKYSRKQVLKKHFMQLNARPVMARGEWRVSNNK